MIHEILPVGMLRCNCSIFGDENTKEAIVIDPGDDISQIQAILAKHELVCKAIVITHAHIDHIGGAQKLKAATGAPVYMNAEDQDLYDHLDIQAAWLGMPTPEQTEIDTPVRDGDTLKLGNDRDPHFAHTWPYAGQFMPLDALGTQINCRRHAISREHRTHGSPRRQRSADSAIDSHEAC